MSVCVRASASVYESPLVSDTDEDEIKTNGS